MCRAWSYNQGWSLNLKWKDLLYNGLLPIELQLAKSNLWILLCSNKFYAYKIILLLLSKVIDLIWNTLESYTMLWNMLGEQILPPINAICSLWIYVIQSFHANVDVHWRTPTCICLHMYVKQQNIIVPQLKFIWKCTCNTQNHMYL